MENDHYWLFLDDDRNRVTNPDTTYTLDPGKVHFQNQGRDFDRGNIS